MKFFEDLIRLLAGEIDTAPVCEIPMSMASAIGAQTQFVYLSSQTVHKQRQRHPGLSAIDYLTLPTHIANGIVLLESGTKKRLHICFERPDGDRFLATLKATIDGRRIYIVRFHRARKRQTKSLIGRSTILRPHKT